MSDRSDVQAAKNEVTFRDANERLAARRAAIDGTERTPFICECEEERCTEVVLLSMAEYAAVRSGPRRFLISPGHPARGEPVSENDRFSVVEKGDVGGEIAARTAPRHESEQP